MESRIARIASLMGTVRAANGQRWESAMLIWQEHNEAGKSFPVLSAEIKAAGGHSSLGHLSRMDRCYAKAREELFPGYRELGMIFGNGFTIDDIGKRGFPYDQLPEFSELSSDPEIREGRESREHRRPRSPDTIHDLVEKFGSLAEAIARYPDGLSMSDRKELRHSIRSVERAIAGHSRNVALRRHSDYKGHNRTKRYLRAGAGLAVSDSSRAPRGAS